MIRKMINYIDKNLNEWKFFKVSKYDYLIIISKK